MDTLTSFSLAEYIGHSRYMFTELFIESQKLSQRNFLRLPENENSEILGYLGKVMESDLSYLRDDEKLREMKSEQQYRAINIVIDSIFESLEKNVRTTRNETE